LASTTLTNTAKPQILSNGGEVIMAKKVDKAREAFTPRLEPGEELRSVGQLWSGTNPATAKNLVGVGMLILTKFWYVGITDRRLLFVRLTALLRKPDERVQFATSISNVRLVGIKLSLVAPEEGMPQQYGLYFGAKRASGFDVHEFRQALTASPMAP
jgi:hypothetical protein